MSTTAKDQPDSIDLNILLKTKIPLFSKEIHFSLFSRIITETYLLSSFHKKKVFRPVSKSKKNLWVEICKSLFHSDKKYSAPRLVVRYIKLYCSIILNKLLLFSWKNKQDLGLIVKLYLKVCEDDIELKHAKNIFRHIVNKPQQVIDKKLSHNLLSDLWKKAIQGRMPNSDDSNNGKKEDEGAKDFNTQRKRIHCRYNVISPYIHPSSINPIDSDSLSQRLNENFELLRFKKIHLKNTIKQYNDQYDPLIKKKRKPFKLLDVKSVKAITGNLSQSQSQLQLKGYEADQEGLRLTSSTPKLLLRPNKSCNLYGQDLNKVERINQLFSARTTQGFSRNFNSKKTLNSGIKTHFKSRTCNSKVSLKETRMTPINICNLKIMNYFSRGDLYY